jgi:hypothetical protein
MKIISDIGIQIPQVYLPKAGTDLSKWAVIACDQFTSEPEYWRSVEKIVGNAPSTLNLTFPEIHLDRPGGDARIQNIQVTMQKYMDEGILQPPLQVRRAKASSYALTWNVTITKKARRVSSAQQRGRSLTACLRVSKSAKARRWNCRTSSCCLTTRITRSSSR